MSKKITNKKNNNKKVVKNTSKKIKNKNLLDDRLYKKAERLYKDKKYDEAYEEYVKLNDKYVKNKKIYKRMLDCLTHDFTFKDSSREFKNAFDDYVTTYRLLATKKEIKYLEIKLENYKQIKIYGSNFLLIALLGWFGVHKFVQKKYKVGILYLLTFGLFGIGVIIDLINDYSIYQDYKQLNIFRYIISFLILLFGILFRNSVNIIYFVIISIIFIPIVYSKILSKIPNFVKIIVILIMCFLGFRTENEIVFIPVNVVGTWKTDNESTNFSEVIIKYDKSTIKFNDRKEQIGINEYDKEKNILKIYVNATTYYMFKIDKTNNRLCIYNESNTCVISFHK